MKIDQGMLNSFTKKYGLAYAAVRHIQSNSMVSLHTDFSAAASEALDRNAKAVKLGVEAKYHAVKALWNEAF